MSTAWHQQLISQDNDQAWPSQLPLATATMKIKTYLFLVGLLQIIAISFMLQQHHYSNPEWSLCHKSSNLT